MRLRVLVLGLCCGCPDTDLWDETDARQRAADLEPPRVVAISLGPVDASEPPRGISVLPTIDVTMSEPLDVATVTPAAIRLTAAAEKGAEAALDVVVSGEALAVTSRERLAPFAEHVLVLAGTLRDLHGAPLADARGVAGPFQYAFVTGDGTTGPPTARLVSPEDGAAEVARNLDAIVVSFDEPVWGTVRARELSAPCQGALTCTIVPDGPLEPTTRYGIDLAGVADADGLAALGADVELDFTTAATLDEEPPAIAPSACASNETATGPVCASTRDVSIALRFATSEAAGVWARAGDSVAEDPRASMEHRVLLEGLEPETTYEIEIGARDPAGNEAATVRVELLTTRPLAPVVITEVYADPAGPEPAQEFVEIHNRGSGAVDLEGFVLADGGGPGAAIGAGQSLAAGGWALLVSDRFDPASRLDPPVAPSALLVRVAGSLGTNGLLNAGEPVVLLDTAGAELSRYPNFLAPRAGVSIARASPESDEEDPASWAYDPNGSATPGAPNQ
ncbi:MAG: Ig-like domain-containing protein [Deltaproteobacteria bacterium]|nr:Ig-like domain-containing protein [Deltaproteobacteria bacterium]